MFEQNLACIRTHRNNIHRYRRLFETELSDLERSFLCPWTGERSAEQDRTAPAATWEGVSHWRTAGETARAPLCIQSRT